MLLVPSYFFLYNRTMDFTPQTITNRQGLKPSFIYKKKSIMLWLNSQYYSSSQFVNNKFYELTFDIPQITLFNTTKLKVVSYIHQSTSVKQMIIRIKNLLYDGLCSHPLNYPIIYVANTNVESQLENNEYSLSLLPQTINNLTLVFDEQFITNFNGLTGDLVQQTISIDNYSDVIRNGVVVNPVVWYKFDTSTNLGLDSMGSQNLTNYNGVGYNTTFRTSGSGSGSFNGTNQYLNKTNAINLTSKDFTISFWSYRTNTSAFNNLYFFQIGNTFYPNLGFLVSCYRSPTGNIAFHFGNETLTYTTTTTYLNTWLYITLTFNNSNRNSAIYLNGTQVATTTNAYNIQTDNLLVISGTNTGALNFQGYIDDFRIYNTLLTQSEITKLYNKINDIYIPPKFVLGLAIEDADMEVYDSVSPYRSL